VADYGKLAPWWSDQVSGTRVAFYAGEATYKVGVPTQPAAWQDPAELSKHLTLDQGLNAAGNVYFSAKDVRNDVIGAMSRVVADHYQHPALTPEMPHLDRHVPPAPEFVRAPRGFRRRATDLGRRRNVVRDLPIRRYEKARHRRFRRRHVTIGDRAIP